MRGNGYARGLATVSVLALTIVGWSAAPASAGIIGGNQVTDFTFDSLAIGSTPPQTFPAVDPQPQQNIYAIGGFPDSGPVTGTVTVQNVGTMSKAAQMSTNQGGTGALYVDTQFVASGSKMDVAFDINVVNAPSTGIPQDTANAPNGQAWVMQAFGSGGRVFRFVVTPTGASTGNFALRNNTDGDVITIGNYTEGSTHHVEIQADYGTKTIDALLDGSLVANDLPFVEAATSDLEELFIFQNGVEGVDNVVAFDNLITTNNVREFTVPEPGSLLLFGTAAAGFGLLRRRRRKA